MALSLSMRFIRFRQDGNQGSTPAMSEIKKYKQGDIIFSQQSACDGVYIIASGLVSISTEHQGKRLELAVLGRGSMFGEMAVIDLQARSATVIALQETEIVQVEAAEFQSNLHTLPLWSQLLIQMLVRRLRSADERLMKLQGLDPSIPVPMFPDDQEESLIVEPKDLSAQEIARDFKD
jgi:CRP/FNR family transcriptional regulator, cyclic AMP receptor protein